MSTYLVLSQPDVLAWIVANTTVPEPPILSIAVLSSTAQLAFSNLVANRQYRLMRSGTLAPSSWTQAHSFTATGPTATWSEPVSPEGRQFYRLEWTQ